jgi:hypothetical protein
VPYYPQPHRCCAGRPCRTACDLGFVRSLTALLVSAGRLQARFWLAPWVSADCRAPEATLGDPEVAGVGSDDNSGRVERRASGPTNARRRSTRAGPRQVSPRLLGVCGGRSRHSETQHQSNDLGRAPLRVSRAWWLQQTEKLLGGASAQIDFVDDYVRKFGDDVKSFPS